MTKFNYARNRRLHSPAWYKVQRDNRTPNPGGYKGGRAGRRARRHGVTHEQRIASFMATVADVRSGRFK